MSRGPASPISSFTRCQKGSSGPRLGAASGRAGSRGPGLPDGGPLADSRAGGRPPGAPRDDGRAPCVPRPADARPAGPRPVIPGPVVPGPVPRAAASPAGVSRGVASRGGVSPAGVSRPDLGADPAICPVDGPPAGAGGRPDGRGMLANCTCCAGGKASIGPSGTRAPSAAKISRRCRNTPIARRNSAIAQMAIDTYTSSRLLVTTPEMSTAIAAPTRRALNRITCALHGPYG